MIRQLTGALIDITTTHIVIDVQGVGYWIAESAPNSLPPLGSIITRHTYLAVRETALDLYGFNTRDELEIFELLLTLPKIGPKSAMQIMVQADITLLKKAVLENDASYLSKMSGIGKKTAEKIVSELHEKFADHFGAITITDGFESNETTDVIDALVALGYPMPEVRSVIKQMGAITDTNKAITEALKQLSP